jgi:glutamyl-tRNA synthetase
VSEPLRVRFAPSPTGHLHVGNARTALFNWLLARGSGGTFILRIEDTDAERSTLESERSILDDLRWLGLDWDEGPDAGGPHGPYRQSERLQLYHSYTRDLIARSRAYRCFCTPDELEAERQAALAANQPPKYSGKCRALKADEVARRIAEGERAAIRFGVPDDSREVAFDDLVRGRVAFNTDVIGDFVILRSDGRPAYNFAVVVDDALMDVNVVVRGEDHISNTPRQVMLYEALGFDAPSFAHLSLVMGPDHAPLSKRHGATSVAEFREQGILPEALVNYLALLGWSPGEGEEVLPAETMASRFDLRKVSHSAAVFDTAKLAWMNRMYLKQANPERVSALALPAFLASGYVRHETDQARTFIESLLPMAIGSVDRPAEIAGRVGFIFEWPLEQAVALTRAEPDGARVIAALADEIWTRTPLTKESFREAANRVKETTGVKGRALFHAIRVALTGLDSGPELDMAVPAIDRGALLPSAAGLPPIPSCADRARGVAARLR